MIVDQIWWKGISTKLASFQPRCLSTCSSFDSLGQPWMDIKIRSKIIETMAIFILNRGLYRNHGLLMAHILMARFSCGQEEAELLNIAGSRVLQITSGEGGEVPRRHLGGLGGCRCRFGW